MYTVDDFIASLRLRYESAKHVNAHYLDEPTPGKLRDLCADIASHELNEDDREVLAAFFGRTPTLQAAIDNTKAVKMKNVLFFLQGRNQHTNRITLNLVAVMLDFKSRPLRKFSKEGPDGSYNDNVTPPTEEIDERIDEKGTEVLPLPPQFAAIHRAKHIWLNKRFLTYTLLLFLLPASVVSWYQFKARTPDCMVWSDDHYMPSSCEYPGTESFNAEQFGLKEIKVKKEDVFFMEGKPVVWYCRRNGYHFFNRRGFDPVTRKPLLPITRRVLLSRDLF